jgi:redox-sensitive bicupin YhaK (pirin superfamily)
MILIRNDKTIHRETGEWFDSRWHFSFENYRATDPANEHFGAMRVFNDNRVFPGGGWPLHPHRDVEALTYVLEGDYRHEDSAGGAPGPLPAGSIHRMTLGRGGSHAELNASKTDPMRFIAVWILPDTANLEPEAEQRVFTKADRTNRLLKVVSPVGEPGETVKVHQDASVYVASLDPGVEVVHEIAAGHGAYVYLIDGAGMFGGQPVTAGAAARVSMRPKIEILATEPSEIILVDVPLIFEPVGAWAAAR